MARLRCEECGKDIRPMTKGTSWSYLAAYFQIERSQGDISQETYDDCMSAVMDFKAFAFDWIPNNEMCEDEE